MGTPGYSVIIVNASDSPITFYAQDIGETENSAVAVGVPLSPGEEFVDHWKDPAGLSGEKPATVGATDSTGSVVYCRRLSFAALKASAFHIRVVRSGSECR
jgi:hypothetical protein